MRIVLTTIFSIMLLVIILSQYRRTKDILSPMVFYCLLVALRYIPGLLFFDRHMGIEINNDIVYKVFIFQTVSVIMVLIGYSISQRVRIKGLRHRETVESCTVMYNYRIPLEVCGYILFVIGAIFGVLFLQRSGGLQFILSSIKGINAGNGNSYIRALTFLMVVGICLVMKGRHDTHKWAISVAVVLMYLFYAFIFVVQTSRSPVLEALMIIAMVYHYDIKRLHFSDIFRPKYIALALIVAIFVMAMPMLRTSSGFHGVSILEILDSSAKSLSQIFEEFSYVARDGFIYNNYYGDRYWYGANLINLCLAPIPSTMIGWKPPVDDGIYLANAVHGHFVKPPATLDYLPWYNSFPMSTPGGMYINFGIIGLIIGSIFIGYLYGKTYERLIRNGYDVVTVIVYQLVIYQLELTSLSIVQTLTPIVVVLVFTRFLCGRRIKYDMEKLGGSFE